MAITFDTSATNHAIEIEEFVDHCERYVDVDDADSIMAIAPMLKALSNNKSLLINHVNDYFKSPGDLEEVNTYSAQSLILAVRKKFFIRTNAWIKPGSYAGDDAWESKLYAYDYAHNHNFNLLTAGYFGSGYYTDLYDFDEQGVVGYAGEPVRFEFLERVRLDRGKVLFYRKIKDIHIQLPPDDFSVSLNFMPIDSKLGLTEQFAFDIDRKTISTLVGSQVAQQVDLLKLAGCIGDSNTLDMVLHLAVRHPNQSTRLSALHAASNLSPADAESFWSRGLADKSEMVRNSSKLVLTAQGPMIR